MPAKTRPFNPTEAEYKAVAAIWNAALLPDLPRPVSDFKRFDAERDPMYFYHRLVVEVDGRLVAMAHCGEPFWSHSPGKYFIDFAVHPEFEGGGIGRQLYDRLYATVIQRQPVLLTAQARQNQAGKIQLLDERGFREVQRDLRSVLDLSNFDPAAFSSTLSRIERAGLRVLPVSELQTKDPEWLTRLWDLEWQILQDIPAPSGSHTRRSLAGFKEKVEAPGYRPDAVFVALDGQQYLGLCVLEPSQDDPEIAHSGMAGVIKDYRRQGIATALKVHTLQFARAQGIRFIGAFNEENNPMVLLNLKLGFQPLPARIFFEKAIS